MVCCDEPFSFPNVTLALRQTTCYALSVMGKPDLFAKRTFASQAEQLTGGAVLWKEAPDIGMEQVQSDGILVIHDLVRLKELAAPWNLAAEIDEILVEFIMQGDHLDLPTVSRTLLRRQARETQRFEERKKGQPPWLGRQTMWLVSAYVPEWAKERYCPDQLGQGCYRWAKEHFTALWIGSNELPLCDELVPFLITRTGRPLRDFVEWVIEKKSWPLLEDLVRSLPMLRSQVKFDYSHEDEESKRNALSWIFGFMEDWPDIREAITKPAVESAVESAVEMGALREARDAVRRILQLRMLDVRSEQVAKIEACMNLDTLHRWHDRAVTAVSADEALAID